jgi:hypothetical protein
LPSLFFHPAHFFLLSFLFFLGVALYSGGYGASPPDLFFPFGAGSGAVFGGY